MMPVVLVLQLCKGSTRQHLSPHWACPPGWYADPKHWRRNTAVAFAVMFAIAVPVFFHSAKIEVHHQAPARPVPSQRWCKNFPPEEEGRIGGAT